MINIESRDISTDVSVDEREQKMGEWGDMLMWQMMTRYYLLNKMSVQARKPRLSWVESQTVVSNTWHSCLRL